MNDTSKSVIYDYFVNEWNLTPVKENNGNLLYFYRLDKIINQDSAIVSVQGIIQNLVSISQFENSSIRVAYTYDEYISKYNILG
jgi:hypothetical protein